MNILILNIEPILLDELKEFLQDTRVTVYMADSYEEARRILTQYPVQRLIFALRTVSDLEFLKYINTTYQQIDVILTVEHALQEIVSILRDGDYRMLRTPLTLSELRACFLDQAQTTDTEYFRSLKHQAGDLRHILEGGSNA